ncbi:hypothetical protein L9F63_020524 [Diploptera punctata]|uniref:RNA 3'-terminal phosphate cyclase-like protein n=1 Tax=Diploptera punctata TaxID=6984 RepID=A0AAD8EDI3_DIPPU|nr:hypothetical protein L9F63_020524 [Diploptera punctata]
MSHNAVISFKGCNYLRQRLILSTLSGKPISIKEIRSQDDDPGLREFEVNLIRLLDKMTNGTRIEVSETGTSLYYQPGLLYGGSLDHECCKLKSIGYYLEVVMALGPFCKKALQITLRGVTNNQSDPSVDSFISSAIPVLKKFLVVDDGLGMKITKRGMAPEGGGEVIFKCPVRRQLKPIQLMDQGKVKRIRGVVYAVRVSPAISNRMVEAAKGVFLQFIPDVYIYTDHHRGSSSGKSPGFGITLVAESTTGVFWSAEAMSNPAGSKAPPSVPEEIGKQAAFLLLEEIYRGGCVDSTFQSFAALFMAMSPKDVSKCLLGPLSPYTIQFLRHLRDFFGHTFKLESHKKTEEEEELNTGANKVVITCMGIGYLNLSRRVI